ncbi:hypothetical protein NN561_017386 [Cricetulus griseus]
MQMLKDLHWRHKTHGLDQQQPKGTTRGKRNRNGKHKEQAGVFLAPPFLGGTHCPALQPPRGGASAGSPLPFPPRTLRRLLCPAELRARAVPSCQFQEMPAWITWK